jgi:hypothetical protein
MGTSSRKWQEMAGHAKPPAAVLYVNMRAFWGPDGEVDSRIH